MKHLGDMRIQIDRWPLEPGEQVPHILSIIVVARYPGKPTLADVINALQVTAPELLRKGRVAV